MNDFSEIINIYQESFQDYVIEKVVSNEKEEEKKNMVKERATTILYSTYREILQSRQDMVRRLSRYILIHDLEQEDFLFLFTLRWQERKRDNIVSNVIATIMDYIKDIEM